METDLKKIKHFGKTRNQENWEFRSFLKFVDIEQEELDSIVHRLYEKVSDQIDCTKCANCCKEMKPLLTKKDIKIFAKGLGTPITSFINDHVENGEDEGEYFFNKKPCPFLEENHCSNYDFRPEDCKSFPHLDKEGFVYRLWGVVDNYSICPIVFNVYEILKSKVWK